MIDTISVLDLVDCILYLYEHLQGVNIYVERMLSVVSDMENDDQSKG